MKNVAIAMTLLGLSGCEPAPRLPSSDPGITPEALATLRQTPRFLSNIIYDCEFAPDAATDPTANQRFYFAKEGTLPDGSILLCFSDVGAALDCSTRSFEGDVTILSSGSFDRISIQPDGAALLEQFEARSDRTTGRPLFTGPLEASYEGVCRNGAAYPDGSQ